MERLKKYAVTATNMMEEKREEKKPLPSRRVRRSRRGAKGGKQCRGPEAETDC